MQDLRQTKEYAKYMEMLGWQAVKLNNELRSTNYAYVKKIPLLGNIAKLQRPSGKLEPRVLDEFARKHKLAVFYIELSHNHLAIQPSSHFQPAKSSFLPSKTIHINLLQSNKELLSQMDKDTRYAIRLAQKRGVTVKESSDIDAFIKLWHQSARHRGMWFPQGKEIRSLWTAFGKKAHLLFVPNLKQNDSYNQHVLEQTVIAGVFIVRTSTTAYYMYAASTKEGNKLSAPSLLVWEAIKLAKKKGCKIFDFEGVYDDRYPQTKSWKGFTKFKEGFGRKIVTYPKTLIKYYCLTAKFLSL